jgi:hypothetical protein
MPWWLWLIPAVVILLYLWTLRVQPKRHLHVPFSGLHRHVEALIGRYRSGAVMLVEKEKSAGLVQIKLVRKRDATTAVEIGIPEVEWSARALDVAEAQLSRIGFATELHVGGGCKSVRRFLRATVSGNKHQLTAAVMTGLGIVAAALEWEDDEPVTVHTEDGWRPAIASRRRSRAPTYADREP